MAEIANPFLEDPALANPASNPQADEDPYFEDDEGKRVDSSGNPIDKNGNILVEDNDSPSEKQIAKVIDPFAVAENDNQVAVAEVGSKVDSHEAAQIELYRELGATQEEVQKLEASFKNKGQKKAPETMLAQVEEVKDLKDMTFDERSAFLKQQKAEKEAHRLAQEKVLLAERRNSSITGNSELDKLLTQDSEAPPNSTSEKTLVSSISEGETIVASKTPEKPELITGKTEPIILASSETPNTRIPEVNSKAVVTSVAEPPKPNNFLGDNKVVEGVDDPTYGV